MNYLMDIMRPRRLKYYKYFNNLAKLPIQFRQQFLKFLIALVQIIYSLNILIDSKEIEIFFLRIGWNKRT